MRILRLIQERVDNPYSQLKLICCLLIICLSLVFTTGVTDAEDRSQRYNNNITPDYQAIQDERILELNRRLDEALARIARNDGKIDELQHDVTLYKGSVLGIGSLLAILELLQALGVVKGRIPSK